jgi:hypothetical protein
LCENNNEELGKTDDLGIAVIFLIHNVPYFYCVIIRIRNKLFSSFVRRISFTESLCPFCITNSTLPFLSTGVCDNKNDDRITIVILENIDFIESSSFRYIYNRNILIL